MGINPPSSAEKKGKVLFVAPSKKTKIFLLKAEV